MNKNSALGVLLVSVFIMNADVYAQPGVNIRLGLMQTNVDFGIRNSVGYSKEVSDDYLSTELNATLLFDRFYVNGEIKSSMLDEGALDAFALSGGYRLNDISSVFLGFKVFEYEGIMSTSGLFAGYSHIFPFESTGTALVLSGALGLLDGELDDDLTEDLPSGLSLDSDLTLGYSVKASYLYPINDQFTVSGDFAVFNYDHEFEIKDNYGNSGSLYIDENNVGFGVTVSYTLQ